MFVRLRRLAVFLIVADALVTQGALVGADFLRRYLPFGETLGTQASVYLLNPWLHLAVGFIFFVTFWALSVYDVRRGATLAGHPASLLRALFVATFVFAGFLYFTFRDVPRLLVVYFFFIELAGLSGLRFAVGLYLRYRRRRGSAMIRVLIVGAGEMAANVVAALRSRLGDTALIVGCVDDHLQAGPHGLPLLGRLCDVPGLVRAHGVDEVIVALPVEQYAEVEKLEYALLTEPVRVRLVPDYFRLVFVQSSVEMLSDIPLIGLREPRITGLAWGVKRLFDIVMTLLLLIPGLPLMALIALWIKLDSPGPVIFSQRRVGENGRLFAMYKFRTMYVDAENRRPPPRPDEQGRPVHKLPDDDRVTRAGRWLRAFSLDELPQFFNVLKGEMSLVGPRPEQQFIVESYEPWQRQRLAVPPGITGWWQVNGRSDLPMHLNTHLDLYYIRNYSLWLDLVILWRTLGAVLSRQGAY
jgi:exopolysaccharide biosynthesis polyprenyl glycosylphosphotransferase